MIWIPWFHVTKRQWWVWILITALQLYTGLQCKIGHHLLQGHCIHGVCGCSQQFRISSSLIGFGFSGEYGLGFSGGYGLGFSGGYGLGFSGGYGLGFSGGYGLGFSGERGLGFSGGDGLGFSGERGLDFVTRRCASVRGCFLVPSQQNSVIFHPEDLILPHSRSAAGFQQKTINYM